MNETSTQLLCLIETICCIAALIGLYRSKQVRQFAAFGVLLSIRLLGDVVCLGLSEVSSLLIERHLAYKLYFYTYWSCFVLEAAISVCVVLGIFRLAMAPLPGLQKLGMLVFRWAAAISVALALIISASPHDSGRRLILSFVMQIQQISSVLTLCLLLFVCFAVRPMGLTFRSRIFGVSFGLGLMSACNLSQAAWISHSPELDSIINVVSGVIGCLTLCGWSAYFSLPEPKRRIIVLPTTSPFLRWNQISEVLGDEPGFVAVAGIPPEVFAPAELEIMARASAKMKPASPDFEPLSNAVTLNSLIA